MAGTIFSLGLQQRVDLNGKPEVGWLLFVYSANSSTPVNTYLDDALTILNPWPLEADSNGMMPPFWLADGSYRVRGTSNDGMRSFFDIPSVLAVGPSTTTAAPGADPTAIFQTGDSMFSPVDLIRPGWVRDNGRTIGSSASGANEHANDDCQNLFLFYWNTYPNSFCPVTGGRSTSASADWASNKVIATLDMRGIGSMGLDTMGNAAAGRLATTPFVRGNAVTPGSLCGENNHLLTIAEMPAHDHGTYTSGQTTDHTHPYSYSGIALGGGIQGGSGLTPSSPSGNTGGTSNDHQHIIYPQGGGGQHNSVHYSVLGTWYRKI